MRNVIVQVIEGAINNPRRTIAIWMVLAFVAAGLIVTRVELDPSFKNMIMSNDPDKDFDLAMKKQFGDDELLVIGIHNPSGVYNPATLQRIDRLTRAIRDLDGVRDIYSLTRVSNIRGQGGTLDVRDLIEPGEVPTTDDQAREVQRKAGDNPVYARTIVADDQKTTVVAVEFNAETHAKGPRREALILGIYKAYQAEVEQAKGSADVMYITGFPITEYKSARFMLEDMAVFGAVSTVLLFVVIFWTLRSVSGVVIAMTTAMVGVIFTYFTVVITGNPISMVLSALMTFVMAVGMQYSIYGMYAYLEEHHRAIAEGRPVADRGKLIADAFEKVRGPLGMAALTTAIGFAAAGNNPVPELQKMGVFVAIGSMFLALVALTLIPALLMVLPFKIRPRAAQNPTAS